MTWLRKLWCKVFHKKDHMKYGPIDGMLFEYCCKSGCINDAMKLYLLCNIREGLHTEEIYASRLAGYFSGMYWMRDAGWKEFIRDSEVGDYKVFKGMFAVTHIKDKSNDP